MIHSQTTHDQPFPDHDPPNIDGLFQRPKTFSTPQSGVLQTALELLSLGVGTIPIRQGSKEPNINSWRQYQHRLPTADEIRRWHPHQDDLGIAAICGASSGGLAILDFDDRSAFDTWAAMNPKLASIGPMVKTFRGVHLWFRVRGEPRRTSRHDTGEVRGEGGYALCPPSRHPNGGNYTWIRSPSDCPIPLIESLEALNVPGLNGCSDGPSSKSPKSRPPKPPKPGSFPFAQLPEEAQRELAKILKESTPKELGRRNRFLLLLVGRLKRHPILGQLVPEELLPVVSNWFSTLPPKPGREWLETERSFRSAWANYAPPNNPVKDALPVARQLPNKASLHGNDALLLNVCCVLAASSPDGVFFISYRDAGGVLGEHHDTAGRRLVRLASCGLLVVVTRGGSHNNRANRYRLSDNLTNPTLGQDQDLDSSLAISPRQINYHPTD
jgi:hypothetical protein